MLRRPSQDSLPSSAGASTAGRLIHTAKAERLLRERMEREGVNEDDADANDDSSEAMSPAEKRALDAEKRAAWRKARLKSLENVNTNSTTQIQLEPVHLVLSDPGRDSSSDGDPEDVRARPERRLALDR